MTSPRSETAEALARFACDAALQVALLIEADGRVIAQHGFTRRVDIVSASTLAAAIQATTRELGTFLSDRTLGPIHHAGGDRQVFLAPLPESAPPRLVLAVFDGRSSLGLVQVYWEELASTIRRESAVQAPAAEHFERDLQRSLSTLFGAP
jgi:hypothetical protein